MERSVDAAAEAEVLPTIQTARLVSRARLQDVAFVAVVAALPAMLSVSTVGFYLDDYVALESMSISRDQSPWGLFSALLSGDAKAQLRPLEYGVLAVLYWLFGTSTLPYQLFLSALVPACAVMLYLVLVRLTGRRTVALAVSILFATAPHYSSARFWLVAFSPTAVLFLYLISLYCVLRALDSRGSRVAGWVVAASAAMVASLFIYEIALPLFLLTAGWFWWRGRRVGERSVAVGATSYVLVLALAMVAKLGLALEVGEETSYSIGGYQGGLLHHAAYVTAGAIKVSFGTYGVGLPYVLVWILEHRFSWEVLATSVLVGSSVFVYLMRGARDRRFPAPRQGFRWPLWSELVGAGLLLIGVGYGLFVVTGQIYMTSVGIDNRVNIIPALGIAALVVGLLLRATELVGADRRSAVFSIGIAGLAAAGVFVTSTVGGYWSDAYSRQQDVLERLERWLPSDPSHSTVLLDRLCPEIGPGIVFLGHYDLAGALGTKYRDTTIEGAVVTDDVQAGPSGVVIDTTWVGVTERRVYPYDRRLLVYDWRRDSLTPLPDRAAARAYLERTPRIACPPPRSFVWGIRTSRWVPFA